MESTQHFKENCDVAAERAILSSFFTFGYDAYVEISDLIHTNTFSMDSNQFIFKCFEHIYKNDSKAVVDRPTILSAAHSLGFASFFDKKQELKHIDAIINFPVEKSSLFKLAVKLKRLEVTRTLRSKILDIGNNSLAQITGDESISHILGLVETPIFDLTAALNDNKNVGPQLIFEDYEEFLTNRMENPIEQIGLSTGYEIYDEAIGGGLRDGAVNVIIARPKQGKSSHADNVALYQMSNQVHTLMLDTEMSKDEHRPRMTACISGIPIKQIETGECGRNKLSRDKVLQAARYLKDHPYYHYLNICGQPFEDTLAEMRRWLHKKVGFRPDGKLNKCLIILDYIKMQSVDPMKSADLKEWQVLGFMTTALVNFAQKYQVPILTYTQINRDGITKEDTDIIAGSDRIGWFASNITILKRQTIDEIAEQATSGKVYNTKLVPLFARHGPGLDDGDYINYNFDRYICKFTEGPTKLTKQNNQVAGQTSVIKTDEDAIF